MFRTFLLIGLLAVTGDPGGRPALRSASWLEGQVPGAIPHLPAGSHALLVEKSSQSLLLYRGTEAGLPELVRVVQASTGEREGDKRAEGDMRTPEGIYFFTGIIDGSQLPAEYGRRAFVTDFPNVFDRLDGKSGSNIWLHATDEPQRINNGYNNTRGCVVVTNEEIDRLTPLIRTGRLADATVMVVEHELTLYDVETAARLNRQLRQLIGEWAVAWESLDAERYLSFYSRSFRGMGYTYPRWAAYKERLTRQYRFIKVAVSGLHIYRHGESLVAAFNQEYESDRFHSRAAKQLYFRREQGGWKIVNETSVPLPAVAPLPPVAPVVVAEAREAPPVSRIQERLRDRVPAAIAHLPAGRHALLVETGSRSLVLYRGSASGLPEQVQVISAGPGDLSAAAWADRFLRTPEGIHTLSGAAADSRLPAEYRQLAAAEVQVVEHELTLYDVERAEAHNRQLRQLIGEWAVAWESLDAERYLSFYSRSFSGMGYAYAGWAAYKERLTRQYRFIKVTVSDLRIFRHGDTLMAAFDQEYESDRFRSRAAKQLFFKLEADGWKIVNETSRSIR